MSNSITLLNQTRLLTRTVQSQESGHIRFADLVRTLGQLLSARVGIVSRKGKVLAVTEGAALESGALLDETLNRYLLGIEETTSAQGIGLSGQINERPFAVHVDDLIILPIFGSGDRLGTLLVNRVLDDEGLVLAEYATSVVGLELLRKHQEEESEESHLHASALMAAKTLSYSETEVLSQVFADLGGTEGLVVASKIADRSGITRSVIVNGLRKLESAGVIVSRSLGMKGTHIKVLNPRFLTELRKLA